MDETPNKLTGEPLSIEELVGNLPALKEVPAALLKNFATGAAVLRRFEPGEVVCTEGEFGSTAFYIVSGSVDIYINNPLAHLQTKPKMFGLFSGMKSLLVNEATDKREKSGRQFITADASVDLPRSMPINQLGAGELFGEMTCRTYQPRAATVRASEDCVMVEMLRVVLDMLVGSREVSAEVKARTKIKVPTFKGTSFKKVLDDRYRERSLESHLRSVPILGGLSTAYLKELTQRAELVSINKDEVICKQGDTADAFYLIRMGLVRVSQSMPGGEMVRTYLSRGEFFGEIGLLMNQSRNATCTALDAVDLVRIKAEDFHQMTAQFPDVQAQLLEIAKKRMETSEKKELPVGLQLDEFLNQGLYEAQNLLVIDLDNCTRCDACVNACADAHDGVTRLIRDGLRYDRFLVATACRSCRDPLCMTQCPVGSIRRKESLEIIIEDWCIGCTKCADLCPYGNINMHPFEVTKEVPAETKPAAKAAAAPVAAKAAAPAAKPASVVAAPAPASSPEVKASGAAEVTKAAPITPGAPASVPSDGLPATPALAKPVAPAVPASPPSAAVAPVAPTPAKPAAPPSAKPAPPAAIPPKKMVKKKVEVMKATTCDLCTQLTTPSCVYACPHDAAKRVEPSDFFARQIGKKDAARKRHWNLFRLGGNRTTH